MEDPQARVLALLETARFGRSLRWLAQTDSTNDDAATDARGGAPNGHTVVADQQARGRGSNGRAWSSPPGDDLYVSIVDRPALALAHLPPLTLAVGLGVSNTVDALLAREGAAAHRSQIKWPNDVLLDGRKCAGVLVEAVSYGDAVESVVIGIGLNVNRLDFPDELGPLATSLRRERLGARPFERSLVLAELLASVEREVDRFVEHGPAEVARALAPRLAWLGRRARCGDCEGVVQGVAESGALRMRTARGEEELYAGRLVPLDP
jgi:BirA family transcriptional regulator, biotin operon repressor / biotin---[acetyl-CoA-carboxylase] ligase